MDPYEVDQQDVGTVDQQTTWTTPDGYTWASDAQGNPYVAGFNPNLVQGSPTTQQITIPDTTTSRGPGGSNVDTGFSLGNVATGFSDFVRGVQQGAPAVFNAIQSGKNAVTAINTPTPTQQWITMPLQTKLILGFAAVAIVYVLVKGKL